MPKPIYDFTDPFILQMVDEGHRPAEHWDSLSEFMGIRCAMCRRPWPCDVRQELDQWRAGEIKFRQIMDVPLEDLDLTNDAGNPAEEDAYYDARASAARGEALEGDAE